MHKELPKPEGRITEKLYSQPMYPTYGTVLIIGMITTCFESKIQADHETN